MTSLLSLRCDLQDEDPPSPNSAAHPCRMAVVSSSFAQKRAVLAWFSPHLILGSPFEKFLSAWNQLSSMPPEGQRLDAQFPQLESREQNPPMECCESSPRTTASSKGGSRTLLTDWREIVSSTQLIAPVRTCVPDEDCKLHRPNPGEDQRTSSA